MKPDIEALKIQISLLLDRHPELAEDVDLRADMLEGSTDLHAIMEKLLNEERQADELVNAVKERIEKLSARRSMFRARQASLRDVMMAILQRAELRKVALPEATVSITRRGPAVQVIDEALVPDVYCRFKREVSKTAIKEAITAGEEVPGAVLDNGGETLRIG
jgi:hexokinase